jgi:uncharacterized protein
MPQLQIRESRKQKIRTLTLMTTHSCNLECIYCYEKKQSSKKDMEIEVAKDAIKRYMISDDNFDKIIIDFFGGEPLLAFSLIRQVVEWVISQEWPKAYHFSIGTNGTLLTNEIKNWLYNNRNYLSVSLSIDGCKKAHDLTRDNSYDLIYPHISFFKDTWPDQAAKMTICAETIPYVAESVIELEEMGLMFTANIAFEDFWGGPEKKMNS